ncbi:MAG: hypothetical protein M3Y56_02575, partial [Armatimonadota bacterium]|nr:hypothetical protein [Armatimonadota bacterium]
MSLAAPPASSSETANLRVYGKVTAVFAPNRAEFQCESALKADVLLGKLLADLFWDGGTVHTEKTVRVAGRDIVLHSMPPYGLAVAGRSGSRVIVLGGNTEAEVTSEVAMEPLLTRPDTQFVAQKPYPITLDFFDLRAFRSYIATPMYSSGGFGIASHWPFLKKFGMNALSFQQPSTNFFNPAPGVVDWSAPDYEVHEAERQGGMIIPSFTAGGVSSLWYYNRFPGSRSQPSPTTLMGSWGRVGGAGDHFESWFTPEAQREVGDYDFERKVMARFGSSAAVGGWQVYAGEPGAEMGNHNLSTEFLDYSAAGQAGFRDWLRSVRGFTLSALGERWYGDPKHYATWNDVTLPDVNSFFGSLDSASLLLNHHWLRRAAVEGEAEAPAGTAGWTPVVAPPSQ